MKDRKIVITGLGIVSPVGSTINNAWDALLSGKSGIRRITAFNTDDFAAQIGGTIIDFNPDEYIQPKEQKKMSTFIQYGIGAAVQALQDSGLEVNNDNATRIGVAIGSGIGGLPLIESTYDKYLNGGPRKISPFFIPSTIINMIAGYVSIMCNLKGPNVALVSACTTGTHNIGAAARIINYGDADVMLAGSAEMATCPLGVGGFIATRALSISHNNDPETASRPWDAERDGFILGDGAGVIVLEEFEHARSRGAKIYCELAGYGMSSDAFHITQPSSNGEGASRCMQLALNDAEESHDAIDYINAHATSTPLGDKAETDAIKATFKDHAYKVAISSTKSMIGHLLGAAGSVEAIITILALHHQIIPPTINLENKDHECDLDYVPHHAREAELHLALSNSFGFGGTNGSLLFRDI